MKHVVMPCCLLAAARAVTVQTLQSAVRHEVVIKKSRFVATAAPIQTAEDAAEFIRGLADSKARHNCFAWRLANGDARSNGDGEPGGTAGPPILAAIDGANLHNVCVLVSRYRLGEGAKLGTGGLVRAYGGVAAECLALGEAVTLEERAAAIVRYATEDTGTVFGLLSEFGPSIVTLPTDPPEVLAKIEATPDELRRVAAELGAATQGRVSCLIVGDDDDDNE